MTRSKRDKRPKDADKSAAAEPEHAEGSPFAAPPETTDRLRPWLLGAACALVAALLLVWGMTDLK